MDADVTRRLQEAVVSEGSDLSGDPALVATELAGLRGDRPREVSLLVAASEQGAARALLGRTGTPVDERISDLGQELAADRGLTLEEARWAVQAWAFALGTGARAPGALPRSGRGSGSHRGLLIGGAAAVVVVAVLALLVPQLLSSGSDGSAAPRAAATSTPGPSAAGDLVVLAHQGGSETFPHETLPAFLAAAKSGAAVETDVHWTSDGWAVLVHDDRTTAPADAGEENPMVCKGGPYTVSKTRWNVLRDNCRTLASASKDGKQYPIPTFATALKEISAVPGAQVVAEVKAEHPTPTQVRQYLATITKNDMAQRVVVSSFYPDALTRVRAQATKDKLALRYLLMLRPSPDKPLPTPEELGRQGLWGVALRSDIATRGNVAGLHAQKLTAVVWTVSTEKQWAAARTAGVDLVLTDRPDAYRTWAAAN